MQRLQNLKSVIVTSPAAIVNNGAFITNTIDTAGYEEMLIIFMVGSIDAIMTGLKLQESDLSNMGGATDVPNANFGVTGEGLPSAAEDDLLFGIHVKLGSGGRKRYMDLLATTGIGVAGTYGSCVAILSKNDISPASKSDRGFTRLLYA